MGLFTKQRIKKVVKLIGDGKITNLGEISKYSKRDLDEIKNSKDVMFALSHYSRSIKPQAYYGLVFPSVRFVNQNGKVEYVPVDRLKEEKYKHLGNEQEITDYCDAASYAIGNGVIEWKDLTPEMKNDPNVVCQFACQGKIDKTMYEELSDELKHYVAYHLISFGIIEYDDLTPESKRNRYVIAALARNDKIEYDQLSEEFKNDRYIVSMLVDQGKVEYADLSEDMKKDQKLVIQLLETNKIEYNDLSIEAKRDDEIIWAAIDLGKISYSDLTSDMPNYNSYVKGLAEMGKVGYAELKAQDKKNPAIINDLISCGKIKHHQLPQEMKKDPEIALKLAKKGNVRYSDLTPEMRNDIRIILALVDAGKIESSSLLTTSMKKQPIIMEKLAKYGKVAYNDIKEADLQDELKERIVKRLIELGKVDYVQLDEKDKMRISFMTMYAKQGKLEREQVPKYFERRDEYGSLVFPNEKSEVDRLVAMSEEIARIDKEIVKINKAQKKTNQKRTNQKEQAQTKKPAKKTAKKSSPTRKTNKQVEDEVIA